MQSSEQVGVLYIIATPIGNYADISARALAILQQVDIVFVEDSRRSGQLFKHFSIKTKMQSYHDHNEVKIAPQLIEKLKLGKQFALISDAGTPLISDPGYKLVQLAKKNNIAVVPIPGACALITALSASAIATDRFCFEGFLATKSGARKTSLEKYLTETRTCIFYEAPHRIIATLEDMREVFGDSHQICVARELTKLYETIRTGQLAEVLAQIKSDPNQQKGEFVIVVAGFEMQSDKQLLKPESEHVLQSLLTELSVKQAVQLAVKITAEKKKILYQRALEIKSC